MAKLGSSNIGHLGSFKNKIINGDFNIWQRGTSFSSLSSSAFTADRFEEVFSNDGVITVSRDTDVPTQVQSGSKSNYSLKIDVTTADATIAAAQYLQLRYIVEGYDLAPMMGKTCTLSFWVKSVKTGTYCVSFRNSVPDRSYIVEYTIDSASTWEKKVIPIEFSNSGGTWDYTTGKGVWVTWCLAAGTDWQSTADTWLSTNDFATSNQANFMDSTDNNFWISQVQFEIGDAATEFEHRSFAQEVALCQRYYEKSYDVATNPTTNTAVGLTFIEQFDGSNYRCHMFGKTYKVAKRTPPTLLTYAENGTASYVSLYNNSATQVSITSISSVSKRQLGGYIQLGATISTSIYVFHWTADAEF